MTWLNSNISWAIVNFGIIALVGIALWITRDLWAFLGLIFLFSTSTRPASIRTQCPKCDHIFVATRVKEDDDEEEDS